MEYEASRETVLVQVAALREAISTPNNVEKVAALIEQLNQAFEDYENERLDYVSKLTEEDNSIKEKESGVKMLKHK